MSLSAFSFTDRARPIVQIGIGDSRIESGAGRWDKAHWDRVADARWAGGEPEWLDITCDTRSTECEYGRKRTTDRFVPGTGTVVVDNASGWADPNATLSGIQTMRPGRPIRFGVEHATYGTCWRYRGFIDEMVPRYLPDDTDTVELACVDALGEVNRAKVAPLPAPEGEGDTAPQRMARILSRALWPQSMQDLAPSTMTMIGEQFGGQIADMLTRVADSAGGAVWGGLDGKVTFRDSDWQTYTAGPPDATIGNVAVGDVCPTAWERPFARSDIATRVILGRSPADSVTVDDTAMMAEYGIEPFEQLDLLTQDTARLLALAKRVMESRSVKYGPRVRSVKLDAATSDAALDLMATVDPYKPSRYRCRLRYPRGDVFDAEHFATGVTHRMTRDEWTLDLSLDLSAPYLAGRNWDRGRWDRALWS